MLSLKGVNDLAEGGCVKTENERPMRREKLGEVFARVGAARFDERQR